MVDSCRYGCQPQKTEAKERDIKQKRPVETRDISTLVVSARRTEWCGVKSVTDAALPSPRKIVQAPWEASPSEEKDRLKQVSLRTSRAR